MQSHGDHQHKHHLVNATRSTWGKPDLAPMALRMPSHDGCSKQFYERYRINTWDYQLQFQNIRQVLDKGITLGMSCDNIVQDQHHLNPRACGLNTHPNNRHSHDSQLRTQLLSTSGWQHKIRSWYHLVTHYHDGHMGARIRNSTEIASNKI